MDKNAVEINTSLHLFRVYTKKPNHFHDWDFLLVR